jgi:choline dehydrogenase-like flavoprotein
MHIDLQEASGGEAFHATVCVVGGGIAGLVLATRLAAGGVDVHVLEAGGLELEERSQALYEAEMAASVHTGSREGRFRTFGGSSTRWGAQLLPYTQDVFAPPAGLLSEGWPIDEESIAGYYEDVQRILGVDALPFSDDLLPALGRAKLPASGDYVLRFSKWAPFHKRNLARTLGAEALANPRITVFSHANAAALLAHANDACRIEAVEAVNYAGQRFRFTATEFVVCAGTVESSRLLLASKAVPNEHDQIGRYFHDHLSWGAAELDPAIADRTLDRLGPFYVKGTTHSAKLEASVALREREKLLPVMAHLVIDEPEGSGAAAIRNLVRAVQRGRLKEAIAVNLLPMLRGSADVVRLALAMRLRKRRTVSGRGVVRLTIDVEQAPDANNRIRLSSIKSDALGLPVAIVDWRVNDAEQQTVLRYARIVGPYLEAAGIAPLKWTEAARGHAVPIMSDTYHPMGGLRMGRDRMRSVVGPDLRVHALENLYVASCAVYPSGGSSNPTFTMMALTMRLADHLAERLGRV